MIMLEKTKIKNLYHNNTSWPTLANLYILILSTILAVFSIFNIFILSNSLNCYKYAYIDYNNNIGLSSQCRRNQCLINDRGVLVKQFIEVRK